jgi:hypothetical protein
VLRNPGLLGFSGVDQFGSSFAQRPSVIVFNAGDLTISVNPVIYQPLYEAGLRTRPTVILTANVDPLPMEIPITHTTEVVRVLLKPKLGLVGSLGF